jgi:hypothetical protein
VPLYYKNRSFINNLSSFNDVAGRTNTSGGPHAARVFETPDVGLQYTQFLLLKRDTEVDASFSSDYH